MKQEEIKKELEKYKKAYFLLMEYWHCLNDDEQVYLNKKLKRMGL